MGMVAMREFFGALKLHLIEKDLFAFGFTLFCGIQFLGRKVLYEFLWPAKCGSCGGPIKVYFMRSPANVIGRGSDDELCDWMICEDDNCREAKPL